MILTRLKLQHFRNYSHLDLQLQSGNVLLYGSNGAGKSNVVEAVFALATTKSFRARLDREMIDRRLDPAMVPFPFARLQGDAESGVGGVRIEMLIGLGNGGKNAEGGGVRKRFRLDGVPRRAADVVGRIKAVLFSPTDVDIVSGSPSGRRRYLDLMLCQVDRSYLRLLQSYSHIVQQRNAALTRIGEGSRSRVLEFWDEKLIAEGSEIVLRRLTAAAELTGFAAQMYGDLSARAEELRLSYAPSIGNPSSADSGETVDRIRQGSEGVEESTAAMQPMRPDIDEIMATFRQRLAAEDRRTSEQRVTVVGPHRDDLSLDIDGVPLQSFGSRGQQRTAALALRMAEARYILHQTGDQPILLLDEALGELDEGRRSRLLVFVREHPQVILTATSTDAFPDEFRASATLLHVRSGEIKGG